MNKKYFLFKESDGARGANGKKKIYIVTVDGVTVTTEWGMAEKGARRSQVHRYFGENTAVANAQLIVRSKVQRGYRLAASV